MNLDQLEDLLQDYELNGPSVAEQKEFGGEEIFHYFKERTEKDIPKEAQDDALDHGMDYAEGMFRIGFLCGCREMERRQGAFLKESEKLAAFLSFLRESTEGFHIAQENERLANDETQDILHRLELYDDGPEEAARLAKLLRDTRRRRRAAKDQAESLGLIDEWAKDSMPVIKSLERLLGALRKAEKRNEERFYGNRTSILEQQADKPESIGFSEVIPHGDYTRDKKEAEMRRIRHYPDGRRRAFQVHRKGKGGHAGIYAGVGPANLV